MKNKILLTICLLASCYNPCEKIEEKLVECRMEKIQLLTKNAFYSEQISGLNRRSELLCAMHLESINNNELLYIGNETFVNINTMKTEKYENFIMDCVIYVNSYEKAMKQRGEEYNNKYMK